MSKKSRLQFRPEELPEQDAPKLEPEKAEPKKNPRKPVKQSKPRKRGAQTVVKEKVASKGKAAEKTKLPHRKMLRLPLCYTLRKIAPSRRPSCFTIQNRLSALRCVTLTKERHYLNVSVISLNPA